MEANTEEGREKKIVVVADSHGSRQQLAAIIKREQPFDVLVHCGDGVDDIGCVSLPAGVTVVGVAGNMDGNRAGTYARRHVFAVGGKKLLVAHGDRYRVDRSFEGLLAAGREAGVDIILFGHTHCKFLDDGVPVLFNPGPANSGVYGVVTIADTITCRHRHL